MDETTVAEGPPMLHLADRFKFLLLDSEAAIAACMVGAGGTFWRTPGGGLSVARNATLIHLGKRQAGQVSSLLAIKPMHAPQSIERQQLPPHLAAMLDTGEAPSAMSAMPALRGGCRPGA